jgi:predicted  nucleic acid-binding Zn-ribbon protein
MADFETQIERSKAEVAEAQSKIAELSARIDNARAKMSQGTDITLDIENASLDDVHAHSDLMNANIAELIMGLDDVTAGFSKDFDSLRAKTGWEKFVGIFSKQRAESLRQERIRTMSIEKKLQDLIAKSNTIQAMLQDQLNELGVHKTKVEGNLQKTLTDREAAVDTLEQIKGEIQALDPQIIELENKLSVATGAKERAKLESELATVNARHNELAQLEQVKLSESQTLERYIEKGKTWVDSLQNQIATQMVLLNKLQTDTKQRVVLYDALSKSLKTAQQQDVAHKINEIGVATDKEAQVAMAAIGAATNSKMAEMLESHDEHIIFARKVLEEKAKADERFARRFEEIVKKHDANAYVSDGA